MTAELRIENDDQKKVVPSALYNNLAHAGGLRLFAFKKEAVVLKASSVRLLSLDARTNGGKRRGPVSHVTAGLVEGKLTAIVTSADGVELWDLAKEVLASSTQVGRSSPSSSTSAAPPAAGPVVPQCTAFGQNNGASFFVTGTSDGAVAFYSVNSELQSTPLGRSAGAHQSAVMAVGTSPNANSALLAASGDANGNVIFWGRGMTAAKVVPPPASAAGDSVTGIVSNNNFFIVAYGGGKVRLFSSNSGALVVEVAAHARWINAIAVEPTLSASTGGQHFATAADDGAVLVWQAPSDANGHKLSLVGQKTVKNYLWTGIAFADAGDRRLFAAAYDVDRAYTFSF